MSELRRLIAENRVRSQFIPCGVYGEKVTLGQVLLPLVGFATGIPQSTCYGLDGPRIKPRWGRDIPQWPRPDLRPTQPPVQWVPGLFPWG
jgi:hypothetical protein